MFKDIKDLEGLARGYHGATKLIGVPADQLIRMPGADDQAAWDTVYNRLGRPEKADGYKFEAPKLPEGLSVDEKLQGWFQTTAHKHGLSARQAAGLYADWNALQGENFTASNAATAAKIAADQQALKTEWGDAYDQKLDDARNAIRHYGGDKVGDLIKELDTTGWANHPTLTRAMAEMGKQLREDGLIGKGGGSSALSPAEAQQQINALRADAAFLKVYTTKSDPGHADAVARMQALYAQAHPATQ
jgi:hypothetical protein